MRRPWWIWRTHPAPSKRMTSRVEQMVGKRKRVYEAPAELMLELEYVGWEQGLLFDTAQQRQQHGSNQIVASFATVREWAATGMERALSLNDVIDVFSRWLSRELGEHTPGRSGAAAYAGVGGPPTKYQGLIGPMRSPMGEMAGVELRDIYARIGSPIGQQRRSKRYEFILTPPVYKFCDLTGVFAFDDVGPLAFWIQPEVFEATGEIMQGSPIGEHEPRATGRMQGGVGARWAITNEEFQKALDGNSWASSKPESDATQQKAATIVRIALDSFLERGTADPRFLDPEQILRMADKQPF